MGYWRWSSRYQWSSPGVVAWAILGVGLVVIGVALGVGGGDVPDGWEQVEGEIVEPGDRFRSGTRRLRWLGDLTERDVRFSTLEGQVVEVTCDLCWGGIGDEVPIAYDPDRPTSMRQVDFYLVPTVVSIAAGLGFLVVGVWWSSRVSVRARRDAIEQPFGPLLGPPPGRDG
jgi:hypothetical protein